MANKSCTWRRDWLPLAMCLHGMAGQRLSPALSKPCQVIVSWHACRCFSAAWRAWKTVRDSFHDFIRIYETSNIDTNDYKYTYKYIYSCHTAVVKGSRSVCGPMKSTCIRPYSGFTRHDLVPPVNTTTQFKCSEVWKTGAYNVINRKLLGHTMQQ